MTSDRRFEEGVPRLLDDLYVGPMPAYRDQLLQQTARIRQRPAPRVRGSCSSSVATAPT
jgi:hypothetical protein